MRSIYFISVIALLLVGCKHGAAPGAENFTKAINAYLAKHGEVCTAIGHQFPIDIPVPDRVGIGTQLSVLRRAGLLRVTDTTAVVHGTFDALRGPTPPQPVKRYELTEKGRKYFQTIPGTLGPTTGFCYGQKSVASIVKWTVPVIVGGSSQAEVTYNYKIVNLPAWAMHPDVQQAFPDIETVIRGQSKSAEIAGLQLTNGGWEVAGQ